jgi:hypothetical protein
MVTKSEAGGGSIALTQRPINSYVSLQGDFLHRAEIFYIGRVKISDFGKKVQLIRNLYGSTEGKLGRYFRYTSIQKVRNFQ